MDNSIWTLYMTKSGVRGGAAPFGNGSTSGMTVGPFSQCLEDRGVMRAIAVPFRPREIDLLFVAKRVEHQHLAFAMV